MYNSGPHKFKMFLRVLNAFRRAKELVKGLVGMSSKEWLRTCFFCFGEKEAEGSTCCSLQLFEEGKWIWRCWSLLPGIQWQETEVGGMSVAYIFHDEWY